MARAVPISDEFAEKRGRQLVEMIDTDLDNRSDYIRKIERIRQYYYGDIPRKLRYPGQPNLHLPVVAEKVENLTLKMMSGIYGADPKVNLMRPHRDVNPDLTLLNEAFLNWVLEIDIEDSYSTIQRWVRGSFLDGPSYLMAYYDRQFRKGVQTASLKTYWKTGEYDLSGQEVPVDRPKLPVELLIEQFGGSVEVLAMTDADGNALGTDEDPTKLDGITAVIEFVENRIRYSDVTVEFAASIYVDEVDLCIYREQLVCDRVVFRNVEPEDMIVPYRARCLQSAERVTRQHWMTIDEIEEKRASGEWKLSDQDMEALRAQSRSEKQEERINNDTTKKQTDRQVGESDSDTGRAYSFEPFVDNKVLIFEVYLRDDADQDGQVEEYIYQIPAYIEKIARADYLEVPFPHGKRPFSVLHGVKVADRFYSLPIAQWLLPINEETDIILNQVHEAQEVINNPFFFYEALALGDHVDLQNGLHPGLGVPVMNAKGFAFPSFPQQPLANLQAIDSLLMFADRLTLAPQLAGSSQTRNAPRTARGTLALMSEGNAKVDSFIVEAQQGGWRDLIYQTHALYRYFGPDEKWFWVTGEQKPRQISRGDMEGRFEYIFRGNTTNTNREVRRTIALQRFQVLAGDPAYLQNPVARRELILDFLRNNQEGVNIDRLDPGLPQMSGTHAPMPQEVELELILVGQDLDTLPVDDDAGHIRVIDRFMNSKPAEYLQPWQVALVAAHKNKHVRQLLSKSAAGAAPGGTVQANNVPTGGDLSTLEGGVQ